VPTTGTSSDRSKPRRKRSKKPRRGDEQDERDAKRRNLGEEEEEEEEEVVSSAPSSPIREPYIPDDEEYSVELYEAFDDAEKYFKEKIGSFLRCQPQILLFSIYRWQIQTNSNFPPEIVLFYY
jgi:hypothetical protein